MKTIAFAFALAAGCLAATPALAGDAELSIKGLDLGTEAGKAELDRRIDVAAAEICTQEPMTGSRIRRSASPRCIAETRGELASLVAARFDRLAKAKAGTATAAR